MRILRIGRNRRSLHYAPSELPGFPVKTRGFDELHAVFFKGKPHTWYLRAARDRKSGSGRDDNLSRGRVLLAEALRAHAEEILCCPLKSRKMLHACTRVPTWTVVPPGLNRLRKKSLLRKASGPQRLKPDLFSSSYVRAEARTLQETEFFRSLLKPSIHIPERSRGLVPEDGCHRGLASLHGLAADLDPAVKRFIGQAGSPH